MDWSLGLEQWSGVLEWILERNLGGKFWSETEKTIPKVKEQSPRLQCRTPIHDSNPYNTECVKLNIYNRALRDLRSECVKLLEIRRYLMDPRKCNKIS